MNEGSYDLPHCGVDHPHISLALDLFGVDQPKRERLASEIGCQSLSGLARQFETIIHHSYHMNRECR